MISVTFILAGGHEPSKMDAENDPGEASKRWPSTKRKRSESIQGRNV